MNLDSKVTLRTGNKMPLIGLGTWQLTKETEETVGFALEIGYRLLDTSSDYGTQEGIGKAIKNGDVARDEIFVATKVEEDDYAYSRVQKNLAELGLEYVDLTLIHRPPPNGAGETLWEGLIKAKKEGLTRDIGVSSYSSDLIDQLIAASGETPVVNQVEWSPFGNSMKLKKYCDEKGIVIQAFSPLTRNKKDKSHVIEDIAKNHNKSPEQVILRWDIQNGIVPLPKASKQDHLEQNLNIFDFELTEDEIEKLNNMNEGFSSFDKPLPYV